MKKQHEKDLETKAQKGPKCKILDTVDTFARAGKGPRRAQRPGRAQRHLAERSFYEGK